MWLTNWWERFRPVEKEAKLWLGISLLIHLVGAYLNEGFHHYDEHFCVVEWVRYLQGAVPGSGLNEDFPLKMRSFFPPYLLFFISKPFHAFGIDNPFFHNFLYRLLSSLLGFLSQVLLTLWGLKQLKSIVVKRAFLLFTGLFFLLPYLHNHPSSEGWGTTFFILGSLVFLLPKRTSLGRSFLAGLLFSLSFQSRYQMGIQILTFGLYLLFLKKESFRTLKWLAGGFLTGTLFCIVLDRLGYHEWTFTAWNYLNWQVLQGGAARNGIDPYWYYFPKILLNAAFPLSILIFFSFLSFWVLNPGHAATWITFPFFLAHLFLAHKEERYLFPLVPWVPLILFSVYQWVSDTFPYRKLLQVLKTLFKVGLIVNIFYLVGSNFRSIRSEMGLFHFLYPLSGMLYCHEKNPYEMASVNMYFFRSKNLLVDGVNSPEEFFQKLNDTPSPLFFFNASGQLPESLRPHCQKIYDYAPTWLPLALHEKFRKVARYPTHTLYKCQKEIP